MPGGEGLGPEPNGSERLLRDVLSVWSDPGPLRELVWPQGLAALRNSCPSRFVILSNFEPLRTHNARPERRETLEKHPQAAETQDQSIT